MIELTIGLGLLPLLIFANYVVINLCKLFPKHILALSGITHKVIVMTKTFKIMFKNEIGN